MNKEKRVFFLAGEVSGDYSAAVLADIISMNASSVLMFGVGGDCLRARNVTLIDDIIPYSSVGFLESLGSALGLLGKISSIISYIKNNSIDLVILVDNQGINLRIARLLKRAGVPVVYYFPPHVSIWGRWNAKKLAGRADLLLCPFHNDYIIYRQLLGARALYVGHYLCYTINSPCLELRFPVNLVGLFPGSRYREVKVHLPILLESAYLLSKKCRLSFVLVIASKHLEDLIDRLLVPYKCKIDINIRRASCRGNRDYLYCDMAMAVSGTLSLELGLLQIPMIIIYKLHYLSFLLAKSLLYTKYISMVNILLGEGLVTELVGSFGAKKVFTSAYELITNKELLLLQRDRLGRLRKLIYKEDGNSLIYDALSRYLS